MKTRSTAAATAPATTRETLGKALLSSLEGGPVQLPRYRAEDLKAGIVHFGVGNFYQSHFATYMDDVLNEDFERHKEWGIVGAGIMHFDKAKRDVLEKQDWLQTLVLKDAETSQPRIVRSMMDYLPVDIDQKEHRLVRDKLSSPGIKLVSMTVTEGGYYISDGEFNLEHPDIQHDIQHPDSPQTIFGMLIEALQKRRQAGTPAFTIMSCDNIPHNGELARSVVVGLAKEMDPELGDWIDQNCAFPTSMVDRITPATNDAQRQFVATEYGYQDAHPVFAEPFRQWVIQDHFSMGRPKWDQIDSVMFVPDVAPFELMKLRILNGGHAAICYPSALLSVPYVHCAMEHPVIGPFLDTLERTEIIPNVPPVPDTNLTEYWNIIAGRFSNPTLMDTIDRNCADGANRQPKFIIPTAKDALAVGHKCDGLALVSALWCRYCQGTRENGEIIEPSDNQWNRLSDHANKAKADPNCWLGMKDIYGKVGENEVFQQAFANQLHSIHVNGVEATLAAYVQANKK